MRTPLIVGNWKMNTSIDEAMALVRKLATNIADIEGVETVVCPPFLSIYPVYNLLKQTNIGLGAQNMFYEKVGAFTGEISPLMLKEFCKYVILGHSERRIYFSETNNIINQKIRAALENGVTPILCVGENLTEMENGKTAEVVERQITESLHKLYDIDSLVVAYEPIWAIGTGRSASPQKASETIEIIRNILSKICGIGNAETTRILYGGSVTVPNIAELMRQEQIDGALVGGASLKANDFTQIVKITYTVKRAP